MKLTGPLITLAAGVLICAIAWTASNGTGDANIGRNIANAVIAQGALILGGLTCIAGVTWVLVRWLGGSVDDD